MARARLLHPSFFTDADLLALSALHRVLFAGLWGVADREGRLRDKALDLKIQILPADNCDVDQMLWDLRSAGRIIRYQVNGVRYIAIPNFSKYQRPHPREAPSAIPPPDMADASPMHAVEGAPRTDPGTTKVLSSNAVSSVGVSSVSSVCVSSAQSRAGGPTALDLMGEVEGVFLASRKKPLPYAAGRSHKARPNVERALMDKLMMSGADDPVAEAKRRAQNATTYERAYRWAEAWDLVNWFERYDVPDQSNSTGPPGARDVRKGRIEAGDIPKEAFGNGGTIENF